MQKLLILVISTAILMSSCRFFSNDDNISNDEFDIPDELYDDKPLEIASEVIDDMIQNVASPVETAALIKCLNIPVNKDYLSNTES